MNGLAPRPISLLPLLLPPTLRGSTGRCEPCPAVRGQPLYPRAGWFPFRLVGDSFLRDSDWEAEKGVGDGVGGSGEEAGEKGRRE